MKLNTAHVFLFVCHLFTNHGSKYDIFHLTMIEYQKITLMEMYNLLQLLLSLEEVYGVFRSQTQDEATRRRSS